MMYRNTNILSQRREKNPQIWRVITHRETESTAGQKMLYPPKGFCPAGDATGLGGGGVDTSGAAQTMAQRKPLRNLLLIIKSTVCKSTTRSPHLQKQRTASQIFLTNNAG